MAIKVEGEAIVKVDGEDAGQKLQNLQKEAAELKRKLVDLKKQPLIDPAAEKELKKAITETNKEIKALQQSTFSVKKVMDDLSGSTLKDLKKAYNKLNFEAALLNRNTQEYAKKREQMRIVASEISRIKTEMGAVKASNSSFFGGLADGFNKYGGLILGFAATVTGAVLSIKSLVQTASDFEERVDNLAALTGLAGKELDWLSDTAKKTSTSIVEGNIRIKQSANDIVDAYTLMGSQRPELLKNKEALHAVTQDAIILSEAAKDKLEPSAKALANTLSQFNLTAKDSRRVINVLAAGSKEGAASVPYLSQAIEKMGTTASLMGMSVEQSVGIIETIAPKFSKAEEAGNSLDKVLLKMKEKNIGFKNGVFDINLAMDQLRDRFKKGETAGKIFGVEHAKMVEVLVQTQPDINRYTKAVTNTNIALEQAATNTDNNAAKLAQARNKFQLVSIELGQKLAPAMTHITTGFSTLVKLLNRMLTIPVEEKIRNEQTEFNNLIGALQVTNQKSEIRAKLIKELQNKYPDYLKNIDLEKASYSQLQQVLHNANIEFNKKIRLAVLEEKLTENQKKSVDLDTKRYELIKQQGNFEYEFFGERAKMLTAEQKKKELEIYLEDKLQDKLKKRQSLDPLSQSSPFTTGIDFTPENKVETKARAYHSAMLQIIAIEKEFAELQKKNNELMEDKLAIEPAVVNPETPTTDNNNVPVTNPGDGEDKKTKKTKKKTWEEEQLEAYDKLLEKAQEFNNELQILRKDGEDAEIEETTQHYDKLILEAQTYKETFVGQEEYYAEIEKELEEQKAADIAAIRQNYYQKSIEDLNTNVENERKTVKEKIEQVKKWEQDQLDNLDILRNKGLISEKAYADKRVEINKEASKKISDIKKTEATKILDATAELANALIGLYGKSKKAQKAAVITQLIADEASSISSLIKSSQQNPLNGVTAGAAGAIQFAAGLVKIIAGFAKARASLKQIDNADQNYEGRYPVIGAQDGKQYNVPYRGNLQTGYLPKGAALFNERGTEAVITAEHLRKPEVAVNYQRILDAINNKPIKQHADGRTPQIPATQTIVQSDQDTKNVLSALYSEIAKLNTEGVKGVWEYDRFKKGVDDHERVKNKTSL